MLQTNNNNATAGSRFELGCHLLDCSIEVSGSVSACSALVESVCLASWFSVLVLNYSRRGLSILVVGISSVKTTPWFPLTKSGTFAIGF
jgi:hypothetical protein